MPKILKDIEKKILDSAIELFKENGYEKVDMRMIAKENKIAVGTLYNYYSNKKELFVKALEESWKDTLLRLDKIIESNNSPEDKISKYIVELYDGVSGRKGLGKELILNELLNLEKKTKNVKTNNDVALNNLKNIQKKLTQKFEKLILEMRERDNLNIEKGMECRLATSIINLTWGMLVGYPNEKKENIEFIKHFVSLTFKR